MLEPYSDTVLWIVIVGFIVAFALAFGIGANDVANSFGTSVGAKVLTVRQACYLATVFEIAGAILIGYKVSDTMRKGILDVTVYENQEKELMLGCLSSLVASAAWMLIATFLKLPISGTHSIVGATVGFSLVARGAKGLQWGTLGTVVASWFVSPLMSGLVSVVIFSIIRRCILHTETPLQNGYRALPFFYGFTVLVNIFSIIHNGPKLLYMDRIPLWAALLTGVLAGLFAMLMAWLVLVPHGSKMKCLSPNTNARANFTMGSNETSPVVSPSHKVDPDAPNKPKRPVSITSNDWQPPLETVTETTENVVLQQLGESLSPVVKYPKKTTFKFDSERQSPSICITEMNTKNRAMLASVEDCHSVLSTSVSPPKCPLRRDILDSNIHSLNNVDLTVTSLNFIDDTLSFSKSVDSNQTCELPNSYDSNKSGYLKHFADGINDNHFKTETPNNLKQLFQPLRNNNQSSKAADCESPVTADPKAANEVNGNKPHKDHYGHRMSTGSIAIAKSIAKLQSIQSGTSLADLNPALTPNSSAVPLILATDRLKNRKKSDDGSRKEGKRIGIHGAEEEIKSGVGHLFSFLQVLTATFGSFAHGGNDVSNAIGPVVGLWLLYVEGSAQQASETPLLILLYGGVGISVGLWLWGRRVIQTVGEDLTEITPSTGFTIEIGAALTVLIASKVGIPISTTHCKVGSVVFVGYSKGKSDGVDWKVFRNIVFAWVVTVPFAGLLSAMCMYIFTFFAL